MVFRECRSNLLFSSKENADEGTLLEATVFVTLLSSSVPCLSCFLTSSLAAASFSKSYFTILLFHYKLMQRA